MDEVYRVTWYCKYTKKAKTFLWHEFNDDVMNKRIVFSNDISGEVLTISSDSYAWMVTRPTNLDMNDN